MEAGIVNARKSGEPPNLFLEDKFKDFSTFSNIR